MSILPTFHPLPNIDHRRIYMRPWQIAHKYRELVERGVTFVDGIDSCYVLSEKVKYINFDAAYAWPDLNNNFIPMLPGEIARTELERHFGKPDLRARDSDFSLLDTPPPNYYTGERYEGKLYYLDLSGAYRQVYQYLTLDCAFPMGQGELDLWPVATVLRDNKLARNAVIGISRTYQMDLCKDGYTKSSRFINPYFNAHLWANLQGVMHELAMVAIDLGSVYIATDGYIFTSQTGFDKFSSLLDDMGFQYKAQWGNGYITGWCSYKVGLKKTKVFREDTGFLNSITGERGFLKWLMKLRSIRQKKSTIGGL